MSDPTRRGPRSWPGAPTRKTGESFEEAQCRQRRGGPARSAKKLPDGTLGASGLALAALALFAVFAASPLLPTPARRSEGTAPAPAARTILPAALLADPQSCGRSGCHPDVAAQQAASAHAAGLDDPWYRASLEHTRKSAGEAAASWCAGCHAPALPLLPALPALPLNTAASGSPSPAAAGVSCAACHPGAHRSASAAAPPASAACAGCHRGSAGEAVNGARIVRLFDDTRAWQPDNDANQGGIRFVQQPQPCLDCHLPRVRSADAGGRGGEVRSHRFAAANTALPALRKDEEQLRAVAGFLRGSRVTVDVFAMTRGRDPAAPAAGGPEEIHAPLDRLPATVRRGESTRLDVVVQARGPGHRLPGGKSDLSDCWLEVKAVDEKGRVAFWSGRAEPGSAVDPDAHFLRTVWLDHQGKKVERYEAWRARVPAYRQLLEPGGAHVARFRIDVPRDAGERLTVTARLRHRKVAWDFHRWAFAQLGRPVPELPIVTLAEGTATLAVVEAGAELPDMTRPALRPEADAARWNSYGLGLGMAGDFSGSRRAFRQAQALAPASAETVLGLSLSVQSLGEAIELLKKAVALDPRLAPAHFFLGGAEREATNYATALAEQRLARDLVPGEPEVQREIGATLLLTGDYAGAIRELEQAAAADPENPAVHLNLRQAYRAAGDLAGAERALKQYERTRADPAAPDWKRAYLAAHPADEREQKGIHEHLSTSTAPAAPPAAEKPGGG